MLLEAVRQVHRQHIIDKPGDLTLHAGSSTFYRLVVNGICYLFLLRYLEGEGEQHMSTGRKLRK